MARTRLLPVAVLTLALVVAPTLAGCSGGAIEHLVTSGVEQAIREATGGSANVNLSGGLPDGFPADAVPVIEGDILGATTAIDGREAWVVTITANDSYADARDLLVNAGFIVDAEVSVKDGSVAQLSSAGYDVKLVSAVGAVVYTVTAKAA